MGSTLLLAIALGCVDSQSPSIFDPNLTASQAAIASSNVEAFVASNSEVPHEYTITHVSGNTYQREDGSRFTCPDPEGLPDIDSSKH